MSSSGSNAGMETSAPLINAIVNNALFHSNSHIRQMPPQIVHILCFFSGRLTEAYWGPSALPYRLAAADLAMKCVLVTAVQ